MTQIRHALGDVPQKISRSYTLQEIEEQMRIAEMQEEIRKRNASKNPPKSDQETNPIITQNAIIPITFERASFLQGRFGKAVNEKVHEMFKDIPAIDNITYNKSKRIVEGSHPIYQTAVNMALRAMFPGIRTATQGELEIIAQNNILPLKGNHYSDSSLVWRSNENPNEYLAKLLEEQFKARNITLKENTAYVLPLHSLILAKDANSPHKVSFEITDETISSYFEARILMSEHGSYINSKEMKDGLPIKVYKKDISEENRKLWTINSGLSMLYLDRYLNVVSYYESLAGTSGGGRVVCVGSEAAAKKYGLGGAS